MKCMRAKKFLMGFQDGSDPSFLRSVEVQVISREACKKSYDGWFDIFITSRMVCAGVPEGGKGPCNGDSGGALVLKKSGKQVGIVSWGHGCAEKEYPEVFTNLADKEIQDFIGEELKQAANVSLF